MTASTIIVDYLQYGTHAARPASLSLATNAIGVYYETDTGLTFIWKGASWVISTADMVGDSGSGGLHGLVPTPASGTAAAGKFLKADGTWAIPSGSSTPGLPQVLIGALDWSTTSSSGTGDCQMTSAVAKTGQIVTGIALPVALTAATSKNYPVMYNSSGFTPTTLVASGSQVTGLSVGVNFLPFSAPYTVAADGLYWVGVITSTAAFSGPSVTSATVAFFTASGSPPSTAASTSYRTNGNNPVSFVY